jgi:hypothetical protein
MSCCVVLCLATIAIVPPYHNGITWSLTLIGITVVISYGVVFAVGDALKAQRGYPFTGSNRKDTR